MQAYGGTNLVKDIATGFYLFIDAVIQTKEAKSSGAMKHHCIQKLFLKDIF